MSILKKLKDNLMGTDEQNKAAQERMDEIKKEKDREQIKKMRKPNLDENWYLDHASKLAATPVDEKAGMFDRENNRAKTARARGLERYMAEPQELRDYNAYKNAGYKKGGSVKSSASKRADGCATKGKTKGRII
jgi:hypothetical protein